MASPKHTPGPWAFYRDDLLHSDAEGHHVHLGRWEETPGIRFVAHATAEANKRLIETAPELLEALTDALDMLDTLEAHGLKVSESGRAAMERYRAVITKATAG